MTPLIGILASISILGRGSHAGGERFFVSSDYTAAVLKAGGVPVILPVAENSAVVRRQLQMVQGLLLIGGYDVDPAFYGQEPVNGLGPVFPERDKFEIAAVRMAAEQGKPILGICRGHQVINVAFGGTLYQDISQQAGPILQHNQNSRKHVQGHTVKISAGTLLSKLVGGQELRANSYHHQTINGVAAGFTVNARTTDGVVEGIENQAASILGVQWHPEMMFEKFPLMLKPFCWLVDSARGREGYC